MKTFLIYLMLFFSIPAFTQEADLPEVVESAFEGKYPNASLDDWKFENGMYYFNYYLKNEFYTSAFDKNGKWIETAEIISDFDLPLLLKEYLKKNYPSGIITYCEKVEKNKSRPFYRAYISGDNEIAIQCNEEGANIKVVENEIE